MADQEKKRGRPPRAWVKLDCMGILRGSINYQLTLEEQAIWIKLFAYSAVCGGEPGYICDNDNKSIPDWYIAQELHCSIELLEVTVKKCITEGRLSRNATGVYHVTNWAVYQYTEYDRQKPYRDAKKLNRPDESDPDKYIKGKYGHMVQRGPVKDEE